jgi:WD40 repeat protein
MVAEAATKVLRSHDNRYNKPLDTPSSWTDQPTDMEFSADGTVVLGIGPGEFRLWNAGNGDVLRSFTRLGHQVTSSLSEKELLGLQLEIVGMVNGALVLLHCSKEESLLVADVTSGSGSEFENSATVGAVIPTNGQLDRKCSSRRLRMSPRSGVHVVGATNDGQLRIFALRNMTSSKRQTTLQMIKASFQQQASAPNK